MLKTQQMRRLILIILLDHITFNRMIKSVQVRFYYPHYTNFAVL